MASSDDTSPQRLILEESPRCSKSPRCPRASSRVPSCHVRRSSRVLFPADVADLFRVSLLLSSSRGFGFFTPREALRDGEWREWCEWEVQAKDRGAWDDENFTDFVLGTRGPELGHPGAQLA